MAKLKEWLESKLERVENPDWYLQLLGSALEESRNVPRAVAVANRFYQKQPHPPTSKLNRVWGVIGNDEALGDYVEKLGEVPIESLGTKG